METIQEIRRINHLSKILKNHGFAEDSLSAVETARNIATKVSKEQSILKTETEPQVNVEKRDNNYNQLLVRINNLENAKHRMLETITSLQNEVDLLKKRLDSLSSRKIESRSNFTNTNGEEFQQPEVSVEISGGGRARDPEKAKLPKGYTLDKLFSSNK